MGMRCHIASTSFNFKIRFRLFDSLFTVVAVFLTIIVIVLRVKTNIGKRVGEQLGFLLMVLASFRQTTGALFPDTVDRLTTATKVQSDFSTVGKL